MDGTPTEPGQRRAAERAASLRAMFPQSSPPPAPQPPPPAPAAEPTPSRRRVWLVPVFVAVLMLAVAGVVVASRSSGARTTSVTTAPTGTTAALPSRTTAAALAGSPVPSVLPSSAAPTTSPASPTPTARTNPAGENLALRRPTTTSGTEGPQWPASAAVDGDPKTRWSSAFADPQWIAVDLAAVWSVTDVRLAWENAYGARYRVDVSLDRRHWSTVYRTSKGTGGTVDIRLPNVPARYVRMYGTKRSSQYGYSLLEFEVR